ncbi:hypothetical protein CB1_000743011 [Camelus ferus]|nr:hypothetical protein CB1_000743011 [Camelus ferus]
MSQPSPRGQERPPGCEDRGCCLQGYEGCVCEAGFVLSCAGRLHYRNFEGTTFHLPNACTYSLVGTEKCRLRVRGPSRCQLSSSHIGQEPRHSTCGLPCEPSGLLAPCHACLPPEPFFQTSVVNMGCALRNHKVLCGLPASLCGRLPDGWCQCAALEGAWLVFPSAALRRRQLYSELPLPSPWGPGEQSTGCWPEKGCGRCKAATGGWHHYLLAQPPPSTTTLEEPLELTPHAARCPGVRRRGRKLSEVPYAPGAGRAQGGHGLAGLPSATRMPPRILWGLQRIATDDLILPGGHRGASLVDVSQACWTWGFNSPFNLGLQQLTSSYSTELVVLAMTQRFSA